jgi:DNA-binding CsgD family transcriptional regulator
MTIQEKNSILILRSQGLTYWQIGDRLGLSMNTVKSFCRRAQAKKAVCRNCGQPLTQVRRQKPKTFCGAHCRENWWKRHRGQMKRKAFYRIYCAHCGKAFLSYGNKRRKYCSHRCYVQERFGDPAGDVP